MATCSQIWLRYIDGYITLGLTEQPATPPSKRYGIFHVGTGESTSIHLQASMVTCSQIWLRYIDGYITLGLTKPMFSVGTQALVLGGVLSALAAAAHLACIVLGPAAYRFMGAGERMARAVEAGKARPTFVTVAIALVLFSWSLFAFSGAGLIRHLPLTGFALPAISLVYLARAVAFPLLKPVFPENSTTFWLVSSGICLVLGLLYAVGTAAVWSEQ